MVSAALKKPPAVFTAGAALNARPCNLQPPEPRSLQLARRPRRRERKRMLFCDRTAGTLIALVLCKKTVLGAIKWQTFYSSSLLCCFSRSHACMSAAATVCKRDLWGLNTLLG